MISVGLFRPTISRVGSSLLFNWNGGAVIFRDVDLDPLSFECNFCKLSRSLACSSGDVSVQPAEMEEGAEGEAFDGVPAAIKNREGGGRAKVKRDI